MTNRNIINSYNNLFLFHNYINNLVRARGFCCTFSGGVIYEG